MMYSIREFERCDPTRKIYDHIAKVVEKNRSTSKGEAAMETISRPPICTSVLDCEVAMSEQKANKSDALAVIDATSKSTPSISQLFSSATPMCVRAGAESAVGSAAWLARRRRAPSTMRAYESSWRRVETMCLVRGVRPLPMEPALAADLIAEMFYEGLDWSRINAVCNVIRIAHRYANLPDPTKSVFVDDVKRSVAKELGKCRFAAKVAISADEIRLAARAAAERPWPRGIQEWAIIAVTWFGALRRSETAALDIDDLQIDADGMRVLIIKSKTDQHGRGDVVRIARLADRPEICAVAAVESWLAVLSESRGPLFRGIRPGNFIAARISDRTVARTVQRFAPAMGLRVDEVGAHSLRAGCITTLIESGMADVEVAIHSRHATVESLITYVRHRAHGPNIAKALVS